MSTALTVQDLGREKVELIKQTVAKGASDLELELFLYVCKQTGLDPLTKQIYAIKRWSQNDQKEVMSFQTGIDGLRLIADRTQKYAGSSDAIFEEKDGKPILAQVTVLKIIGGEKCAFTASARYEEYVQKNRQMQPTSMWAKMPYLMLAKCAEAQALRKAFPMELSVLYTNEEMSHLDSDWKESLQVTPQEIAARVEPTNTAAEDGASEVLEAPRMVQQASDAPLPPTNYSEEVKLYRQGKLAGEPAFEKPSNIFDQSSALLDHETALNDCKTDEDYKKWTNELTNDPRLDADMRKPLMDKMFKLVKALRLKK